jgi:hypothetical protein
MLKSLVLALGAASLVAAPAVAAPANPAASLSLNANVRAGSSTAQESDLALSGAGVYVLGALGLVIFAVVIAAAVRETPGPTSP